MWQTALNTVAAAAVAALAAVLSAAVRAFGDAGVEYLRQKQQALKAKLGEEEYRRRLNFARQAWSIVEEYFRITPAVEKTMEAKQRKFAEVLKHMVPCVTDAEIEQLRQTVAGEVNRLRSVAD